MKSPPTPLAITVLFLKMCEQRPCCQPQSAIRALHHPPQSLLVGWTNPCHYPHLFRLQQSTRDMTGPSGRVLHLTHVCIETYPAKKVYEDVEGSTKPLQPGQGNQPVIHVEKCRQLLDSLSKSLTSRLRHQYHHQLETDHGFHHHVGYHGGQMIALG